MEWNKTSEQVPPEDVPIVWTASSSPEVMDEVSGVFHSGLFFIGDRSGMYCYYTPFRWRLA